MTPSSSFQRRYLALVVTATLVAMLMGAGTVGAVPSGSVDVQLLAINDFHGNLEPPSGSSGRILTPTGNVNAGGIAYLATHIKALEATNPRTLVVSAGDLIGASPLLSALFHDEPTIEAMNSLGLDFNAVGNHEFDEGGAELLRMQNGGCHPTDGCLDGDGFAGADFQFLAANVVREDNGKTVFPAYKMRSFAGAKIAFIGVVLEGTPTIVTPAGVAGLDFLDEASTVNALVPGLKAKGIETIVVLIHEGGFQTGLYDQCTGISGPVFDIVNALDDEVDVVISGHTHQAYDCSIDGKLVTSASSFGRLVTDIDLTIDRTTGEVTSMAANNVIVTRDVAADAAETALIARYNVIAAPLANRVIGSITSDITRTATTAGESALGDVIADAQLEATAPAGFGEAVVAFMNPGGIRADMIFGQISGGELPGEITYGESFTVQPFGNSLVTMTLTGAQIETLLEQQFAGCGAASNRILQVSDGFSYTWVTSALPCDKVDPTTIKINGVTVGPTASYRVTVNSFLADGGDSFPVLVQGTNRLGGAVDTDALEAYFVANSPVAPGPQDRITRLP
ncbi:MAG: bifunctional metallophosphatase/5'-nucleotidase [Chloroflexi bacterium RBG_16_69_14]|nr:MAG: 5'-nucleotidase, 5'-nucleotidase [Chloroflexi bacterium CSP1-4]OGO52825.1 MAG: bifunctional metallophosphatase/5'-nucleotidase [Chloroflexi bacterium RBG_16_69_14]HLE79119.1 bifunctional metallophosphatase/5'-nucleotidase [Candidatus Limnocylindrales bacterium]